MYNVYQPAAYDADLFGIACSMKHWYYECFTVFYYVVKKT